MAKSAGSGSCRSSSVTRIVCIPYRGSVFFVSKLSLISGRIPIFRNNRQRPVIAHRARRVHLRHLHTLHREPLHRVRPNFFSRHLWLCACRGWRRLPRHPNYPLPCQLCQREQIRSRPCRRIIQLHTRQSRLGALSSDPIPHLVMRASRRISRVQIVGLVCDLRAILQFADGLYLHLRRERQPAHRRNVQAVHMFRNSPFAGDAYRRRPDCLSMDSCRKADQNHCHYHAQGKALHNSTAIIQTPASIAAAAASPQPITILQRACVFAQTVLLSALDIQVSGRP